MASELVLLVNAKKLFVVRQESQNLLEKSFTDRHREKDIFFWRDLPMEFAS